MMMKWESGGRQQRRGGEGISNEIDVLLDTTTGTKSSGSGRNECHLHYY
jgi:hypothetical protein